MVSFPMTVSDFDIISDDLECLFKVTIFFVVKQLESDRR